MWQQCVPVEQVRKSHISFEAFSKREKENDLNEMVAGDVHAIEGHVFLLVHEDTREKCCIR